MQRAADWKIRGKNAVKAALNILCRSGRTVPFRMKMAPRRTCSRTTIVYGRKKKFTKQRTSPFKGGVKTQRGKMGRSCFRRLSPIVRTARKSQSFLRHTRANSTGHGLVRRYTADRQTYTRHERISSTSV